MKSLIAAIAVTLVSLSAIAQSGPIRADNGSDMYITGTYDTRWDNGVLNPAFRALTAEDFEVIQLGWKAEETRSRRRAVRR